MNRMSYDEFKEYMINNLVLYLPGKYASWKAKSHKVTKMNQVLDVICLMSEEHFRGVTATIYVLPAYEKYSDGETLGDLMQTVADKWVDDMRRIGADDFESDAYIENLRKRTDKIIFRLVNGEKNALMLERVPHRPYMGLEIVYYMMTEMQEDKGEILITNSNAKLLGLSEEELYRLALKNTVELQPLCIENITDAILNMFEAEFGSEIGEEAKECICIMMKADEPRVDMWVFSNEVKRYGAYALLYPENLQPLAESIDADLYVLTSSVHELIVVSEEEVCIGKIKELVSEIANDGMTPEKDYLGEKVYKYCRRSNALKQVA